MQVLMYCRRSDLHLNYGLQDASSVVLRTGTYSTVIICRLPDLSAMPKADRGLGFLTLRKLCSSCYAVKRLSVTACVELAVCSFC